MNEEQRSKQEALEYKKKIYKELRKKYSDKFPDLADPDLSGFDYERDVPDKIKAIVITQGLKNLGTFHQNITRKVLQLLWEAYQKGYFHGDDEQYDTFKEWVDAEIVPFFSELSNSYITGLRLVVERGISYIHKRDMEGNPIIDVDGNPITADKIVNTANTSQIDNINRAGPRLSEKDEAKNDELLTRALSEKPKEFRSGLQTEITFNITAYRYRQDGVNILVIPDISEEEMAFLINANQGIFDIREKLPEGLTIKTSRG